MHEPAMTHTARRSILGSRKTTFRSKMSLSATIYCWFVFGGTPCGRPVATSTAGLQRQTGGVGLWLWVCALSVARGVVAREGAVGTMVGNDWVGAGAAGRIHGVGCWATVWEIQSNALRTRRAGYVGRLYFARGGGKYDGASIGGSTVDDTVGPSNQRSSFRVHAPGANCDRYIGGKNS